jgi:HK97 family phage major capsid protein
MEAMQRAYDEYRKAVEAERALSAQINDEGRAPSAEENQQFERMGEDVSTWKHEVERLLKLQKSGAELDALRGEMSAFIAHEPEKSVRTDAKSDGDRLIELKRQVEGGASVAGFDSVITREHLQTLAKRFTTRALSTPGGTAIDTTFIDRVLLYEVDESPMLDPAVVQVIVTARGEQMDFPRLTADATLAGTLVAEAGTFTEADPTLSKVSLNAYKYGGIELWSAELDEDDVIGLQDILAQSAARHIVEQVNSPLTTGDGSNKPNGIITAAANGGTASGTANNPFFGASDLIDLFYGRKAAYRRRGNWLASTTGLAKIRKLQDSTGQLIWQPSLVVGAPETVLGRPIFENPDMAAVGSASKSILFGDTQRYVVRRVGTARVELSRDYKFNTDQLALKVVERIDGDLLDANAVAYLVSANA